MDAGLDYVTLGDVRTAMSAANPVFDQVDVASIAEWGAFGSDGAMNAAPFESPVTNYYMTDPISRASETMAECTREFVNANGERTGTDG